MTAIDPALACCASTTRRSASTRLRRVEVVAGRARRLEFTNGLTVTMADDELLVLAVPPAAAAALLPGTITPEESRAIVNAHFRLSRPLRNRRSSASSAAFRIGSLCATMSPQ